MTSVGPEGFYVSSVLYWTNTARIPVIPCDGRAKTVNLKDWPKLDFTTINYEENAQKGLYDNGIALRLGETLPDESGKTLYSFALDFDGSEAVEKWFGNWDQVEHAATKTRIEWHGDKSSLHMLFLAKRPVKNKKITIGSAGLEVRCENNLLFASPSIHPSGEHWCAVGTEEIAILDEFLLLQLESRIDQISQDYMSDENKQEFIKHLESPFTRITAGGRHHATLVMANSYFFRSNGEWSDLPDDKRYDRLVTWHIKHCQPRYLTSQAVKMRLD